MLDPSDIVHDPSLPEERLTSPSLQRVCQPCYDEVNTNVPSQLRSSQNTGMESIVVSQTSLAIPGHMRGGSEASSQISDLAE